MGILRDIFAPRFVLPLVGEPLNFPCPPADVSSLLIRAEQLSCQRGGRQVFSRLDLGVSAGQLLWLRGPNGSGKTSLLRLLAGLAQPESGAVLRPGGTPAYIGHSNALKDELLVHEALSFLCSLQGQPPERPAMRLALEHFGLRGRLNTPVRRLSQGQRRKLALSRLRLSPASVWLLDEPYDALDSQGIAALDAAITAHAAQGGAVILTSHQAVNLPNLDVFEMPTGASA